MKVEVYDKNDKLVCKLEEGQRLLGSYPIDDGMRIHVCSLAILKYKSIETLIYFIKTIS